MLQPITLALISSFTTTMIIANIEDPITDLNLNDITVVQAKFEEFKTEFQKTYDSPTEEAYRFQVFSKNLNKLQKWNDMESDANFAKYKITKFADLTTEEMYRHTGFVPEGFEL